MKKLILILSLFLGAQGYASAQKQDYQKTVEELIDISGGNRTVQMLVPQIFSTLKQQFSKIPAAYWDETAKEISQTAGSELAAMLVPVYRKHLSLQELEEIIAFYKTPAGKKLAEASPQISAEALAIGQQWGFQVSQKIYLQLKEKGYL